MLEIHVVRPGESLYSIARDYGVNPAQMAAENDIPLQQTLVVGQTVVVQFPETVHIVRAGETLSAIVARYGVSVNTLYRNNRWLMGQSDLNENEVLVIAYFRAPLGTFSVSGYAYPSISMDLLRGTLPYLTEIVSFTYGITQDGHLLPLADEAILEAAREYGTAALLHLSTVTEQGNFSNGRSSMVLRDPALQRQFAGEVLDTIRRRGYAGVDIDFEFVFPEEREAYAAFVALLRDTLNPEGYSVTVALAPLPNVRQVLEYALSEIPAQKIRLGIPNYGYDWTLPFVQGSSRAQSISNQYAVELARRYGAEISYDETAQSPWFHYWADGVEHEVWFEDARSIDRKLHLAAENGLLGVGYWNLDRPFPQNWLVVNALYDLR